MVARSDLLAFENKFNLNKTLDFLNLFCTMLHSEVQMNPINLEQRILRSFLPILARTAIALCFAFAAYSSRAQSDQLFVADDGVNTGGVGQYNVTISPGSAAVSIVNAALITTPSAGASTQVRVNLAASGNGILYVGEWSEGSSTATIGSYTMSGAPINANLLSVSDSTGAAPLLAADGLGNLFVAAGGNLSEYSSSGTLEKSIVSGTGTPLSRFTSLSLDGSGDLFAAFSSGSPLQGQPYHSTVSEYTAGGSVVNSKVVTAAHYINSIAVGGGNLYVSFLDGPPDLFNQISEYTTGGTLLQGSFLPAAGNLALDGQGDLFVDSYGDGTISAYTATGTLLIPNFLSGVTEPETMAAFPIPEPSVTALTLVAAGALAMMRRIVRTEPG